MVYFFTLNIPFGVVWVGALFWLSMTYFIPLQCSLGRYYSVLRLVTGDSSRLVGYVGVNSCYAIPPQLACECGCRGSALRLFCSHPCPHPCAGTGAAGDWRDKPADCRHRLPPSESGACLW